MRPNKRSMFSERVDAPCPVLDPPSRNQDLTGNAPMMNCGCNKYPTVYAKHVQIARPTVFSISEKDCKHFDSKLVVVFCKTSCCKSVHLGSRKKQFILY